MSRLISLDELEAVLCDAESIIIQDYTGAMSLLNGIAVALEAPAQCRREPFGEPYADWVMSEYRKIAKVNSYDPAQHEADTNVSPELPLKDYFPFSTRDPVLIGKYLTGVGLILAEMRGLKGARVVEYGVGWGHVTAALARTGFDVTCVDIEPKFLALAKRQAEQFGCTIRTHLGEFGDCPYVLDGERADAVVFFEAFHHAFNHREVLSRIRERVLRPGGRLILAGEPINPAFPYPWGIRPDGHALWAVRRNGWMELGFQEDYLIECLLSEGFLVQRTFVEKLDLFGLLYNCTLHEGLISPGHTMLPSREAATWTAAPAGGEARRWAQANSLMSLDRSERWSAIELNVINHLSVSIRAYFKVSPSSNSSVYVFRAGEQKHVRLELPQGRRCLEVFSETAVPQKLGMNDDARVLGVSIEQIRYLTNG